MSERQHQAKQRTFETLQELSKSQNQALLRKISLLDARKARLNQQMQQLELARQNYLLREQQPDFHLSELANLRRFCANIRSAIQSLSADRTRVEEATRLAWEDWRAILREQKGYEKLATEAAEKKLALVRQRERKLEDEIAALMTQRSE